MAIWKAAPMSSVSGEEAGFRRVTTATEVALARDERDQKA